jgi:hypothetical protein
VIWIRPPNKTASEKIRSNFISTKDRKLRAWARYQKGSFYEVLKQSMMLAIMDVTRKNKHNKL